MNLKWALWYKWYWLYRRVLRRTTLSPKRFPSDYSHKELADLVVLHRDKRIEAETKYSNTVGKLRAISKELSELKRIK